MRSSRALRYESPRTLRLDTVAIPDPEPGDVLVRVRCCGICGTDLRIFEDGYTVAPGQRIGHEFSGEVVGAPGVAGVAPGDRVVVNPMLSCGACPACLAGAENMCHDRRGVVGLTVDGAFADYVTVPRARLGAEVLTVPEGVSDEVAALTEPLAVALHAVAVSRVDPTDHVVIYGAGTIGLCVARWLRDEGVQRVVVVDPVPLRRRAALLHGAAVALNPHAADYEETLRAELAGARRPGKADVVVECAGAPGLLEQAVALLRPGGRLTLTAVRDGEAGIPPMRVLLKELTVQGAMAYTHAEFARALRHVAERAPDLESLISHRFALDEAEAAFAAQGDRDRSLKVMIVTKPLSRPTTSAQQTATGRKSPT